MESASPSVSCAGEVLRALRRKGKGGIGQASTISMAELY